MKNIFLCLMGLNLFILACKEGQMSSSDTEKTKERVKYIYHNGDNKYEIKVNTIPKRVVLFQSYTTELLLAMGLKDRIIMGTMEGSILPQYQKDYESIPYKHIGHRTNINKEEFLLMEPDMVSGFPWDINENTTGTPSELIQSNIYPFFPESITSPDATLEDVFKDFELIGKIFSIEKKMNQFILNQKNKLNNAKLKEPSIKNKKTKVVVCWFSATENGMWIYSSLVGDFINKANGEHIFNDVKSHFEFVSFESVLDRNPDVIFMVDFISKGENTQQKIQMLKNNPILKNISAVKNNRLYGTSVEEIYPSIRNVDFIIKMNKVLY